METQTDAIAVQKAVLHILDGSMSIPVLSTAEMNLDPETAGFLSAHIEKLMEDSNLKKASFRPSAAGMAKLCSALSHNPGSLLEISTDAACLLFELMTRHVEIPPADIFFVLFLQNGQQQLGILKLNYRTGYTHMVESTEEGNINTLIKYRTLLPSEAQKVDECAFISMEDGSIRLIEKEYEINGEKTCYLSSLYLECETQLSGNAKLKIIEKAARAINKKYFDEDPEKTAQLKKSIAENYEETGSIQVDTLVEEVYGSNLEIREEYLSEIRKGGLTEPTVSVPEKLVEKRFGTHKICTDTGIEINLPTSLYHDRDKIEFLNNPDGTLSILIKNISRISNK